jgi:hypothetical protein
MAQVVKLKRTAVQGKVPTTSSLELGELAINTYDGRIFFEKDNGTPSIQSVLVTDTLITGSINLFGAVTASYFKGDGSQITNLPNADVSQVATVTASFDNQSNISVTHNFSTRNVLVSVYDTNFSQIIPSSVTLTDNNTADIVLSSAQSGFAVVAKGGHIVSGTLVQEVTEVATVSASFSNQSNISVTHNFNSKNIIVSVYDSSDSQIIPSSVTLTNLNTTTIGLSSAQSGYVVVAKGGHLVTATGTVSYNNLTDVPAGILSGSTSAPAGTVSGSSQLTASYDTRYVLSGSITQTTWNNIASKPDGIVSGSSQVIDLVSSLNSATGSYATTGSNTFIGTQNVSGSIIPGGNAVYDLGDATHQFRHLYLSSGSLYIDGTKVLGSSNQELQITTDTGQSFKILESGTDTITLQSADGDIQLKSSGGGNVLIDPTTGLIDVRGTLQIQDGYKLTSSGGTSIQIGNDLGITGSIITTGNVNGINLSTFSSSLYNQFLTIQSNTSSQDTKNTTLATYTGSVDSKFSTIGTYTGSIDTKFNTIGVVTASLNVYTSSQDTKNSTLATYTGSVTNSLTGLNAVSHSHSNKSNLDTINQDLATTSNVVYNSITTAGTASIGTNLTVYGDLKVWGTQSIINSQNLEVADNIIYLAPTSSTDTDLGIVGHYNDGTYKHAGIFMDASDGHAWKVFNGLTAETLGTVDTSAPSFTLADFKGGAFTGTSFTGTINSTNGVVSGSSQVDLTATTNYASGILTRLNAVGVFSGSAQVSGIGNSQLTNSSITIAGTSTSLGGSISLATITNGSGIVSGSSQISLSGFSTTNLSEGTNLYYTDARVKTKLNAETVVSGSSQITLSSTTGFGTYLNQAVLTSSTPTFTALTITGTSANTLQVRNTNASSNSNLQMGNDGTTNGAGIALLGSSFASSGQYRANGSYIYSNLAGGLTLHAEGANSMYLSTNGTTAITISSAQNATFAGTITENSSIRYKENVETIKYGLDKVLQMRGVTYDKKDNGVREMGVIAEEVYDILPEVVLKNEEGEIDSVSYGRIVGVLIEAIKEQQKQIEELKSLIK